MKIRLSIDEHMNSYTKILTDVVNVDVKIDEEDKAVILLTSLPEEEYRTVCGIMCQSQNNIWIARGIKFGGVDHSENSSRVPL